MTAAFSPFRPRWLWACVVLIGLAATAGAKDLNIEAKLIWGTNDDAYSNPKHTRVEEVMAEKLRKIFKWKNYFVVTRQTANVPSRGTKRFRMSERCEIEMTELEGPRVEVKLIGEGKLVNKFVKQLSKGESFTIGGEDKNDCAWFIVITELE